LLLLLITAPWFIAVSLANREFFHFFFVQEHFERFLTKQHGPLPAGLVFHSRASYRRFSRGRSRCFRRWRRPWKRIPAQRFQPRRFLLLWCVFGVRVLLGIGLEARFLHPADFPGARAAHRMLSRERPAGLRAGAVARSCRARYRHRGRGAAGNALCRVEPAAGAAGRNMCRGSAQQA
jgi:hypothetical protein